MSQKSISSNSFQNEEEEEEREMQKTQTNSPAIRPTSISTNSNNNQIHHNNSHYTNNDINVQHTDTPILNSTSSPNNASWNQFDSWADGEFEPIDDTQHKTNPKLEEAKRKREEKKLQRQQEFEQRRASRSNPLKLGAKKMGPL